MADLAQDHHIVRQITAFLLAAAHDHAGRRFSPKPARYHRARVRPAQG